MDEKEKKKKNPHAGHRERLKGQFREYGLEKFTDVQALELLLFYAIPRRDTNELAHALLDRFGSFRKVLEADWRELAKVDGIGESAAVLISVVAATNRRYLTEVRTKVKKKPVLDSIDACCEYVEDLFRYRTEEELWMICLNGSNAVTSEHKISQGDATSIRFVPRDLVELALRQHAVRVILTHNHIADIAVPSNADLESTRQLCQALRMMGIDLVDHIVVADNDSVSMRADPAYNEVFK